MQPRLMRSRTEVIVAGVCGGLGEYFNVDPVIIRLIFVLVTLTTGLGLIIYPALWLAMPKAPPSSWGANQQYPSQALGASESVPYIMQEAAQREQVQASQVRAATGPRYAEDPPPPSAYNFDPITGQPIRPEAPTTGQTVQLPFDPTHARLPAAQPGQQPSTQAGGRPRGNWWGIILLGIGMIALANAFDIDTSVIFPILLIGGGLLLLRKK